MPDLTPPASPVVGIDPVQLKAWLAESGRLFLVFDAADLVDALPVAELHQLQAIVERYERYVASRGRPVETDRDLQLRMSTPRAGLMPLSS